VCRKKLIILILFAIPFTYVNGQINYVLNYSFEKDTLCSGISNCPNPNNKWYYRNWYCPSGAFIDWFSFPCFGSSATQGVPQNLTGYQYARTGQCYAGIVTDSENAIGYITGTLSDSLRPNKKYCVTFYVSLSDSDWWATNSIGAYFSNDSICVGKTYNVLPYTPQIENPATNFLTNKVDWVSISGEFQASGGEIFITIGDFYKTTLGKMDSVGHGGFVSGENSEVQADYYVDDVYVRELTIANAGKADTICNGGGDSTLIGMNTVTAGVSFSWKPTTGLANPNAPQTMASPSVTTTYTLKVVNDSIHGCNCADSVTRDSVTITAQACAGINELKNNQNIKVSPNPNNGLFSISGLFENMKIDLYDCMGRLVNSTSSKTSSMQFNLSNNSDGIYLIRIFTKDSEFVGQRKVVKIQKN